MRGKARGHICDKGRTVFALASCKGFLDGFHIGQLLESNYGGCLGARQRVQWDKEILFESFWICSMGGEMSVIPVMHEMP